MLSAAAEPADLGARIVVLDALREVAAGDRGCRVLDPPERAAGRPGRARGRAGRPRSSTEPSDDELDEEQLVERVVDLVERRRDDEELTGAERLELDAEARITVDRVEP